ncbi:MAG: translation elongation factor Ts [Pseudomonadota bacterium]
MSISASLVKELRERTGLGMMECKKALVASNGDIEQAIEDLRKSSGMKAAKKASRVAADGVIEARQTDGLALLLEVNSETDFVARDDNFKGFVSDVADQAIAQKASDVPALMAGDLETQREALVQKIGENITVRQIVSLEADVLGTYVHGNARIGVIVGLNGGSEALAKDIAMHVAAINPQFATPDQVPADLIEKEKEIFSAQAADSGKPADIIEKMVGGRIRKFLAEISLSEQDFVKDPSMTIAKLLKDADASLVDFVRVEVGEGIEKEEKDFATEVAEQLSNT